MLHLIHYSLHSIHPLQHSIHEWWQTTTSSMRKTTKGVCSSYPGVCRKTSNARTVIGAVQCWNAGDDTAHSGLHFVPFGHPLVSGQRLPIQLALYPETGKRLQPLLAGKSATTTHTTCHIPQSLVFRNTLSHWGCIILSPKYREQDDIFGKGIFYRW